ncbi:MAG: protein YgfX [Rhodanobacter sp.]
MTSAPAIGFEYRPSRGLLRCLIGVAALAILAIVLCALAWWFKVVLTLVVVVAAWRSVHRIAAAPIVAAGWGADNEWTLHLRDHEDVAAILLSFRMLGDMVLLRLRVAGSDTHALLLMPDNSDADTRRRLRMRLATVQHDEAVPRL